MGFRGTHLLYVAAELGVADVLQEGPAAADEIAARLGAQRDPLHRVLRALAQLDVLAEASDGRFSLTPVGDCLRTDRPGSLRPLARFWGHEMMQRAWGSLLHTIMTGETAFDHAVGMSAFAYLQSHPDAAAIYHDGMAKIQTMETNAVIDAYEFPPCGTIVDVGGGNGSLLAAILQTVPATGGVVFDLPNAQADVEATIRTAGLTDRVRFEPGDFFTEVTADGDCYLLRQIIHDWEDDDAITILRTCRRAIAPGRASADHRADPASTRHTQSGGSDDRRDHAGPARRPRTHRDPIRHPARGGWLQPRSRHHHRQPPSHPRMHTGLTSHFRHRRGCPGGKLEQPDTHPYSTSVLGHEPNTVPSPTNSNLHCRIEGRTEHRDRMPFRPSSKEAPNGTAVRTNPWG